MKRAHFKLLLSLLMLLFPLLSRGWGRTGHEIVARIAMQSLSEPVRKQVLDCLDKTSPEEASVWMDERRRDHDYDFMKPWHYINIPRGENYLPSNEENIITELTIAYRELKHKSTLCREQAKNDLMILFHLVGDLHQPLHAGYGADKGGNDIKVQFMAASSNLHWVWDDQIIQQQQISLEDCLALGRQQTAEERAKIGVVDFVGWMKESRSLLDKVYLFSDNNIDEAYNSRNKAVIEQQLLYAGIRLGRLLRDLFPDTGNVGMKASPAAALPAAVPVSIAPADAGNYIGKEVTVCGKVFGGKFLDKANGTPTFINMGAPFPGSPFTVVIFGSDRSRFDYKPEDYLEGKDICVTGRIKEYKGKPEIIVSRPGQITMN